MQEFIYNVFMPLSHPVMVPKATNIETLKELKRIFEFILKFNLKIQTAICKTHMSTMKRRTLWYIFYKCPGTILSPKVKLIECIYLHTVCSMAPLPLFSCIISQSMIFVRPFFCLAQNCSYGYPAFCGVTKVGILILMSQIVPFDSLPFSRPLLSLVYCYAWRPVGAGFPW